MGTNSSNKSNGSSQLTNGNNVHTKSNSAQVDPGVTLTQAGSVLLDYSAVGGIYAQNWNTRFTLFTQVDPFPRPWRLLRNDGVVEIPFWLDIRNVWSYEQLLIMNPRIGSALTFSQMMFITLQSLPGFITFSSPSISGKEDTGRKNWLPRLRSRQVPLIQWASQVLVHTTGSLLNNWAFAFNVPLTVLIVFRSAVSFGAILATLSKSSVASSTADPVDTQRYALGIVMIVTSLLLTGILGVLQEQTYKKYGPCWKEGVFYTVNIARDVKQGLASLNRPGSSVSGPVPGSVFVSWLILAGNLVSQLICVSGVNKLTSRVSSVSTNLVLTTRKAISLCFSVWWFGSGWNAELAIGACMVFAGSLSFSLVSGGTPLRRGEGDGKDITESKLNAKMKKE
ncbi:hypothetical protein HHX47_DHR2000530 [Lentinula edodes]|nr:hypothetical protein HHX47_DHR2000530 [Lentinula edodes]